MKSTVKMLANTALFLALIVALSSFKIGDKKEKAEEMNISDASQKLEQAIESRKFADAKEVVNEILPWMKADIKADKKILGQIGKTIDESEIDKKEFSKKLKAKNSLYESTKKLVDSSPAAIRVKGRDLVKMINEYVSLIG